MSFLNETLHPEAGNLLAAILMGSDLDTTALRSWRENLDLDDNRACRLYDLVAAQFGDARPDSLLLPVAVSKVSHALWESGL